MIKNLICFSAVVFVFIVFTFNGCVKDKGKNPSQPAPNPDVCDSATYNLKIKAIVDAKCASCHSPAGGPAGNTNLTNYAQVSSKASRIKVRAIDPNPNPMPPASVTGTAVLTSQEKSLLQCWIDKGTPE
jgi:uncharacterized membrane protein